VQYDTPSAILARPADAFVDSFLGGDRALRRLGLVSVEEIMTAPAGAAGPALRPGTTLRGALSAMLEAHAAAAVVRDEAGAALGEVTREQILAY